MDKPDIKAVVERYIQLRDEKASIAERHKTELSPIVEGMDVIERWLLAQMDQMGVDSLKTTAGTPYKAVTKSVKMIDPEAYKRFVFEDVIDAMERIDPTNMPDMMGLLTNSIKWDLIDFRPLKKGVTELIEETGELPPGLEVSQFQTINIRRS